MNRVKVKICGLRRKDDIEIVNTYYPDYVGFVFAPSKRKVHKEEAFMLKGLLDSAIQVVGVFVNEDKVNIIDYCREGIIDIIQLHGEEDEAYMEEIRNKVENPIIKAIRVKQTEDILRAENYPCDFLLLDRYHEESYGGMGLCFDWSLIPNITKPYFLAGGINQSNVEKALVLNPYGIDISSGVESQGFKDEKKVADIMTKIKRNG